MDASLPGPQAKSAHIIPAAQFLKSLLESGLLPAEEVHALAAGIGPDQSDGKALALSLVKQERLTLYQANMIYQGKTRGLTLGRFIILEKLGQGGMGMVYKAMQRGMGRTVAIKVLPPAVGKNTAAVQRFQREVQAAAQLNHPNIVRAYDADNSGSVHFLVMEHVDGSDLSRLVKANGPFSVSQAVTIVLQAAHGLAAAHAAGVIHRDIKPSNLLLDGKGTIKILDMGLARFDAPGVNSADAIVQDELTKSGSILGTTDYMAPEQAINTKRADQRADIYSLGCTLYYLLTGQAMYAGETPMEKLLAHREVPIPLLRERRPEVSAELDTCFQRMVAKKPEQRPQSMNEVVADLETVGVKDAQRMTALRVIATVGTGPPSSVALDETQADLVNGTGTSFRRSSPRLGKGKWLLGGGIAATMLVLSVLVFAIGLGGKAPPSESDKPIVQGKDTGKEIAGIDEDWQRSIAKLQPGEQVEAVSMRLRELNPGFDGKVARRLDGNGVVINVVLSANNVTNLTPLRALPKLKEVVCNGSGPGKGKLADLSPLRGLALERFECGWTEVSDLAPLAGMPLRYINCGGTKVTSLAPLAGMPLTHVHCLDSPVRDLKPLQGMKLTHCNAGNTAVADLSPLVGMPLKNLQCSDLPIQDLQLVANMKLLESLNISRTKVKDLSPIQDLPLVNLDVAGTPVTDLTPLKKLRLTAFSCAFTAIADLTPLASMPIESLDIRTSTSPDLATLRTLPLKHLRIELKTERDQQLVRSLPSLVTLNGAPYRLQWVTRWRVLAPMAFEAGLPFALVAGGAVASGDLDRSFPGKDGQPASWQVLTASPTGFVGIKSVERASAFGYATIESPVDRDVSLLVGSDDGLIVWVNGIKVHETHMARGWKPDSDRVTVQLRKGTNPILIRCDNNIGAWGFSVAVPDADGK